MTILKVLYSNGQSSTAARSKVLQGHLPRRKWYVITNTPLSHDCIHVMFCFEVPVIAVFTKYEQFLYNVAMEVSDDSDKYPDGNIAEVAERLFREHYLHPLGDNVTYVRLQSEFKATCQ
jgi:hypothetical protein